MATLNDLAQRMKELTASLSNEASRCAVDVALALEQDLVLVTPVDTSNALSNWQVSLDAPIEDEITPYVPGVLGLTKLQSASEAMRVAREKLKAKKPGQIIYIVNNAPYIGELNDGSSKQAPAGFVERCVLNAKLKVKDFNIQVK